VTHSLRHRLFPWRSPRDFGTPPQGTTQQRRSGRRVRQVSSAAAGIELRVRSGSPRPGCRAAPSAMNVVVAAARRRPGGGASAILL
jgi:hypothetical protein